MSRTTVIAIAVVLVTACADSPGAPAGPLAENEAARDTAELALGAPIPAPDVRVSSLDALGVNYVATRRPIVGDEFDKSVVRIELPALTEAQHAAVRRAYGNVSDVRFSATHSYRLSDFLWPVAQATIDQNIGFSSEDIEGLPANFSLQTNCWSTVYEIFRAAPDALRVFQNSVDDVLAWFDDEMFWAQVPTWADTRTFASAAELATAIETLAQGDVVVASDCYDPENSYCEAVHAAVVVDRGLVFERTGGATATDVYRLAAMTDFVELWYYSDRRFSARRRVSDAPLPDPRWVLDFTQGTEGWYTYFLQRSVPYQMDPQTGIRSLDSTVLNAPLDAPPVAFSDLTESTYGAPYDELFEILELARDGALAGCGGGKFCPSRPLTRAQLVHIVGGALADASGGAIEMPSAATNPFYEDVALSDWFAPRVQWAREAGLITSQARRFRPRDPVTRAELVVIFEEAIDYFVAHVAGASDPRDSRLATVYDDTIGHWAEARIANMTEYCRIAFQRPDDSGALRFSPNQPTTRADAARALYRLRACLSESR